MELGGRERERAGVDGFSRGNFFCLLTLGYDSAVFVVALVELSDFPAVGLSQFFVWAVGTGNSFLLR